ncbi:MAG: Tm-1-like ATP-binding domain-containing protein, partial [Deltaproteobacteria bacterium]
IPQVWAPCCLNITGAGPTRVNREKYIASGRVYKIDAMRAMARFPLDEMLEGARLYADKINKARGPIKLVVPLKGWSSLDREGSVLYNPEEDRRFIDALKSHLTVPLAIQEVDCNLEDMDTAAALGESLEGIMNRYSTPTLQYSMSYFVVNNTISGKDSLQALKTRIFTYGSSPLPFLCPRSFP